MRKEKFETPSKYGSHRKMVLREYRAGVVLLLDEKGVYLTTVDRLDSGLADSKRWDRGE